MNPDAILQACLDQSAERRDRSQRRGLLLPTEIAGQKIEYIVLNDASEPTLAIRNARKLASEDHVVALIGSTWYQIRWR
jgi:hypothetical protein